jgi:hypothetical protein
MWPKWPLFYDGSTKKTASSAPTLRCYSRPVGGSDYSLLIPCKQTNLVAVQLHIYSPVVNLAAAANGFRLQGVPLTMATMPTDLDLLEGAYRLRKNLLVRTRDGEFAYHIITAYQDTRQVTF